MSETARHQLSVRLTVLLGAVLTASLLIGGAAGAEGPPPVTTEYVVAPGDTLWEVASAHAGGDVDIRNVIADIKDLSDLEGSTIHPGQILQIPRA